MQGWCWLEWDTHPLLQKPHGATAATAQSYSALLTSMSMEGTTLQADGAEACHEEPSA